MGARAAVFPGGVSLFDPPENIYARTSKFQRYDQGVRDQSLHLLAHDKETLKASLRKWMHKLMNTAPRPGAISTRRLNNLVFTRRGLRLREFISLTGRGDFSSAVFNIRAKGWDPRLPGRADPRGPSIVLNKKIWPRSVRGSTARLKIWGLRVRGARMTANPHWERWSGIRR